MKVCAIVILSNANIDMFKGSIRLVVSKWGYIEVIELVSFLVKDDKNHSLVEYKLANVPKIWASCTDNKGSYCITWLDLGRNLATSILNLDMSYLILQSDRNVNFYNKKNISIWATNSILFSHFKGTNVLYSNYHNKM
ncbi:hypothetical protein IEQ34_007811 [Dendrobium chrysotoxum]|uniref:Single-stranded DNA binding protein Ssb-like OB fold domain-containing protein n=1 Tax=Dendrobium chrysotoxum TaxID=161865 RepID=A0AAV7GN49_DENCH|nr:hypothetical protein IEQ34_007811 [Dendrobium chrysotoxum]